MINLDLDSFYLCFWFDRHQKGVHLWQRATFKQGATDVSEAQFPQTNCMQTSFTNANLLSQTGVAMPMGQLTVLVFVVHFFTVALNQ